MIYIHEYEEAAASFHVPAPLRLATYALGVAGEAGEVADLVKKHLGHGHPLDLEKLKLELGDVLWYITMLASLHGLTLAEVAQSNIDKLTRRYPNGFSNAASIARKE